MGAPPKVDPDLKQGPRRRTVKLETPGARGRVKPTIMTAKKVEDLSSQRSPREAGDPRSKIEACMVMID